jgi:hypothetical protein
MQRSTVSAVVAARNASSLTKKLCVYCDPVGDTLSVKTRGTADESCVNRERYGMTVERNRNEVCAHDFLVRALVTRPRSLDHFDWNLCLTLRR